MDIVAFFKKFTESLEKEVQQELPTPKEEQKEEIKKEEIKDTEDPREKEIKLLKEQVQEINGKYQDLLIKNNEISTRNNELMKLTSTVQKEENSNEDNRTLKQIIQEGDL